MTFRPGKNLVRLAIAFLGGLAFQWPLGSLSDRFDRRKVLMAVSIAAAVVATVAFLAGDVAPTWRYFLIALIGGMSLPLYSLTVAHTNDHLRPEQMVAAASTLYIYYGIAATSGPIVAAFVMQVSDSAAFYAFIAVAHGVVGLFALWRMTRRAPIPTDEQSPSLAVTGTTSAMATALSLEAVRDHMDSDLAAMSRSHMRRR